MATRAKLPFTLSRSMRILWLMKRKVGTSFIIRSYVALSRTTACCALSLTFPLDHFFFFAAFPPLEAAGAALALAWKDGVSHHSIRVIRMQSNPSNVIFPLRMHIVVKIRCLSFDNEHLSHKKWYSPLSWGALLWLLSMLESAHHFKTRGAGRAERSTKMWRIIGLVSLACLHRRNWDQNNVVDNKFPFP